MDANTQANRRSTQMGEGAGHGVRASFVSIRGSYFASIRGCYSQSAVATVRNKYWKMLVHLTKFISPWKKSLSWLGIHPCTRNSWPKERRSCDTNGLKVKKPASISALSVR